MKPVKYRVTIGGSTQPGRNNGANLAKRQSFLQLDGFELLAYLCETRMRHIPNNKEK